MLYEIKNRARFVRYYIVTDRYGQDEIEQLLLSLGAKEIVEIPQRELLPGEEDPAWVRKSSRKERTKN